MITPLGGAASGEPVQVIGAGLAGSEAAWHLAEAGIPVILHEMRPERLTPAHQSGACAELVCSNSLGGDDPSRQAAGLLHAEMRQLGSLTMAAADVCRVPAGGALAVDRDGFAAWITARIQGHPRITLRRGEVITPPTDGLTIIATGPLTSDGLAHWLEQTIGRERLAFFDAIAPVVILDSVDMNQAWRQSRYDKGGADYINCPLDPEEYRRFREALLQAEKMAFRDFEQTPYFEGCMPIEVLAERGEATLRFGPMKPVGLRNPHRGNERPHAVVQLRQDNQLGTLWNLVGFQTKMTWPEQQRVLRLIPGLEQAEFARLGSLHRNTYLDAPRLLDGQLRLREHPQLLFAGQITGVEGYSESAAMGLLVGHFVVGMVRGEPVLPPPPSTMLGALLAYITGGALGSDFQPMNANFGLLPPMPQVRNKGERKAAMANRALSDLQAWIETNHLLGR